MSSAATAVRTSFFVTCATFMTDAYSAALEKHRRYFADLVRLLRRAMSFTCKVRIRYWRVGDTELEKRIFHHAQGSDQLTTM